jgi:hypothetical protein
MNGVHSRPALYVYVTCISVRLAASEGPAPNLFEVGQHCTRRTQHTVKPAASEGPAPVLNRSSPALYGEAVAGVEY